MAGLPAILLPWALDAGAVAGLAIQLLRVGLDIVPELCVPVLLLWNTLGACWALVSYIFCLDAHLDVALLGLDIMYRPRISAENTAAGACARAREPMPDTNSGRSPNFHMVHNLSHLAAA